MKQSQIIEAAFNGIAFSIKEELKNYLMKEAEAQIEIIVEDIAKRIKMQWKNNFQGSIDIDILVNGNRSFDIANNCGANPLMRRL